MESEPNFDQIYQNAPPLPYNSLKLEKPDDNFCTDKQFSSSKPTYLQDFHHLDHNFQLPYSSPFFTSSLDIRSDGSDPFDPSSHVGSCSIFDFQEFIPWEENGIHEINCGAAMQNSQGGVRFLDNYTNRKDLLSEMERIIVPDESSCVTADNNIIGFHKDSSKKADKHSKSRKGLKNSNLKYQSASMETSALVKNRTKSSKGQWTVEEDRILIDLVDKYGVRKWSRIAQMLKGRIGKQCRERWHNHLRPDIKKDLWTEEEDRILIEAHAEVGNKWAEIMKRLPGRTENSIKNHWNATKRRQLSRRKCKTKWARPSSLLQNYIKSLHLGKEGDDKSSRNEAKEVVYTKKIEQGDIFKNNRGSVDFGFGDDYKILPDYEFGEVREFGFGGYDPGFDSIIDGGMELMIDETPLMHCEVKEEVSFFNGMEDMDAW